MSPRKSTPRHHLTQRDMQILKHIAEFKAADISALHCRFFPDKKQDAVKSTLRRLSSKPHFVIRTVPLDGKRVWYQLTQKGARVLGLKPDICRELGHQARARWFALQWFLFVEGSQHRRLCQLRDFPELFPIQGHRLPQGNFYLASKTHENQTSENLRFGYVMIDCGAAPQRIARRAAGTLQRFCKHGWFDDFISRRQFELTLLTITRSRKRAYQHALPETLQRLLRIDLTRFLRPGEQQLPIHLTIHVVPRLLDLIPGRSDAP